MVPEEGGEVVPPVPQEDVLQKLQEFVDRLQSEGLLAGAQAQQEFFRQLITTWLEPEPVPVDDPGEIGLVEAEPVGPGGAVIPQPMVILPITLGPIDVTGGRIKTIRRLVSLVLAVFPFERSLYRDAGVPVEFVGHPLLDALVAAPTRAEARHTLGLADDALVVGLLPGSRRGEAGRMLPLMREAAARLAAVSPGIRFLVAQAPTLDDALVHDVIGGVPEIRVVRDATQAVMRSADLLLVTSGTATLEAALLGTPMIVCYRVSRVSELLGRLLVRVPWIGLANLVLGRAVVPELCRRRDLTADRIVVEAQRLLGSAVARAAQRCAFAELRAQLGEPGVGVRAARLVLATAGRIP